MFGLPVGLLIRIGAALALAAACWYAWHEFTGHYEHIGEARVQAKWDADKARAAKATADVEAERDAIKQQAEKAIQERDHERELRQADAQARARSLPAAVAGARFPGIAVRVLNDAIGDPAAPAGAARNPPPAAAAAAENPDSTAGQLTEWGVTVIQLYETCRARVTDWRDFYAALLAAQPKEQTQ